MRFVQNNLAAFSEVREKTRYYFCKYLYYNLMSRAEDYLVAKQTGISVTFAENNIKSVFRVWTYLDRHRSMSHAEMLEVLRQSAISLGGIFEAFNFFFFAYATQSWLDLLPEVFGVAGKEVPHLLKTLYLKALKQPLE